MNEPTHIVSVLTPDRRGIIHRLVTVLGRLGVPHVQISQTVVHGAFTIALVLAVPPGQDAEAVRAALLEALDERASATLLALDADTTDETAVTAEGADVRPGQYLLTAIGRGVSGVVREVTRIVLEHDGNFTDFSSRLVDDRLQLLAEVELPAGGSLEALQAALGRASEPPELTIRLQHQRLFAATNEIAFRRGDA